MKFSHIQIHHSQGAGMVIRIQLKTQLEKSSGGFRFTLHSDCSEGKWDKEAESPSLPQYALTFCRNVTFKIHNCLCCKVFFVLKVIALHKSFFLSSQPCYWAYVTFDLLRSTPLPPTLLYLQRPKSCFWLICTPARLHTA